MLTFIRYMKVILHMHLWIVFMITRILLNQGSLYQGSVPYILLSFWMGWRKLFVIPRTSLYRGSLNRGSTVVGTYVPHPRRASLTLLAPIAAYKFSKLISIHFLTELVGRIWKMICAFNSFGNHFVNSHDLFSWLCINMVRRKLMFVTLGT